MCNMQLPGLVASFREGVRKLEGLQRSNAVYFPAVRDIIADMLKDVVRPITDALDSLVDPSLRGSQRRTTLVIQEWTFLLTDCMTLGFRHREMLFEEGGESVIQYGPHAAH